MAKKKQPGGIYTKTHRGQLERIKVECRLDTEDTLAIVPAIWPNASLLLKPSNGTGVVIPRNRALRLARLIRTMALQLPKEGK